jgi:hypothetical protein
MVAVLLITSGRLFLNREVINLLSYRGISSTCLLSFQLRNIHWLISSLMSSEAAVALLREKSLNVLPWSHIARHPRLFKERFFRRLLQTLISNNLHQLVTRAHIRVPKARYMFGVADEYALLEPGQIFVQITDDDGSKTVLEGPIAITKNPCHHPGDLRVLLLIIHVSIICTMSLSFHSEALVRTPVRYLDPISTEMSTLLFGILTSFQQGGIPQHMTTTRGLLLDRLTVS